MYGLCALSAARARSSNICPDDLSYLESLGCLIGFSTSLLNMEADSFVQTKVKPKQDRRQKKLMISSHLKTLDEQRGHTNHREKMGNPRV